MPTLNLLRDEVSAAQISAVLKAGPLLPPLGDNTWRTLARRQPTQNWATAIREQADREKDEPLPVLTDELYADFWKTGTRLNFERLYFERRRRLGRAVMSVVFDGPDSPRLDSALRKLDDVFSEVSWSLPAHVTHHPDGKDPRCIDLFCAETANLMGQCLDLLGPVVPVELARRIRERLQRDVFDNYLARHDEFWWTRVTMNWNAVCHQGVIGAALAVERDPARLAKLLQLAATGLRAFLDGFTPDGGCTEGPGYWEYGFGWFMALNEQLEQRTAGQLSLVDGDAHVRAIARYGPAMYLANGYLVNFSDCTARTGASGAALPAYLATRFGDASCRALAIAKYRELAEQGLPLAMQRGDLFYFLRTFQHCPTDLAAPVAAPAADAYFPDLGVVVERGNGWEFAAKAGHNGEHHNHNDCGSYLLHVNGQRWAVEIGSPEYVKAFFSERRYEFFAARSRGHSVPVINGCEQIEGREAAARILEYRPGHLVMDLTRCYPAAAECRECIRTFDFDKQLGQLRVADRFVLTVAQDLETVIIAEDATRFRVVPGEGTVITGIEEHTYNAHDGQPARIQRIVLKPATLSTTCMLSYSIQAR